MKAIELSPDDEVHLVSTAASFKARVMREIQRSRTLTDGHNLLTSPVLLRTAHRHTISFNKELRTSVPHRRKGLLSIGVCPLLLTELVDSDREYFFLFFCDGNHLSKSNKTVARATVCHIFSFKIFIQFCTTKSKARYSITQSSFALSIGEDSRQSIQGLVSDPWKVTIVEFVF